MECHISCIFVIYIGSALVISKLSDRSSEIFFFFHISSFGSDKLYPPQKYELSVVLYSCLCAYANTNDFISLASQNLGTQPQGMQSIFMFKKQYVCDCLIC